MREGRQTGHFPSGKVPISFVEMICLSRKFAIHEDE